MSLNRYLLLFPLAVALTGCPQQPIRSELDFRDQAVFDGILAVEAGKLSLFRKLLAPGSEAEAKYTDASQFQDLRSYLETQQIKRWWIASATEPEIVEDVTAALESDSENWQMRTKIWSYEAEVIGVTQNASGVRIARVVLQGRESFEEAIGENREKIEQAIQQERERFHKDFEQRKRSVYIQVGSHLTRNHKGTDWMGRITSWKISNIYID